MSHPFKPPMDYITAMIQTSSPQPALLVCLSSSDFIFTSRRNQAPSAQCLSQDMMSWLRLWLSDLAHLARQTSHVLGHTSEHGWGFFEHREVGDDLIKDSQRSFMGVSQQRQSTVGQRGNLSEYRLSF